MEFAKRKETRENENALALRTSKEMVQSMWAGRAEVSDICERTQEVVEATLVILRRPLVMWYEHG